MSSDASAIRLPLMLAVLGALAGLCAWWLVEGFQNAWLAERTMLGLSALAFAFFTILLALTGPLSAMRAVVPSVIGAAVLSAALWWAAGRHGSVETFLELAYPFMAFGMALLILTPLLAAALDREDGWRHYPTLFRLSWQIVVRYAAAAIFTGLFWGLLSLSDALLRIVGIELIELITRQEALAWALTGAVFGLALAVVHELSDFISPYLVLRLLRLFLPLVLLVAAVFVVMLPLRGWDGLLSGLSPAATLIAFAVAAVVLVTVAVERDNRDAAQAKAMRFAVQLLALLIPVLGGLALWAIWLRVGQYGWTPPRLIAMTLAVVCLAYGAAYGLAVLLRGGWMVRIRDANVWLALASLGLCLIWLTPLLNPEQISARSQLERASNGQSADRLPLRIMANDWGLAGLEALDRMEMQRPDLADQIAEARSPILRQAAASEDLIAGIGRAMPIYPGGTTLPVGALGGLPLETLQALDRACANRLPEGPGCALYLGPFKPDTSEPLGLLFLRNSPGFIETRAVVLSGDRLLLQGSVGRFGGQVYQPLPDSALVALHSGKARLEPSAFLVLKLNGLEIFPNN